jgi:glycine cleavage system H protein
LREDVFRGRIPEGFRYDPRFDMWLRREGEDIIIGASSFGLFLAGEVIAFTPKPMGAEVECGRGFGTIECAKTVLALHAPVAFRLLQANEEAEAQPRLIMSDPYGKGWMVRGRAFDLARDETHLLDAGAYRAHVLSCDPNAVIE